jgi:hypothetical protein
MIDRRSMIARVTARLIALSAVALVTSGSQYSCSSGDIDGVEDPPLPPPRALASGDGPTFTTTLSLKDSSGTEKSSFGRGELITFELTVRNRTDQPVTVSLSSPQQTDFLVFRNGADTPAWNASHGTASAAVITPLAFGANETKVLSVTWNQEIPDGTFLRRGNYEARGAVLAVGVLPTFLAEHELASTFRAFAVN